MSSILEALKKLEEEKAARRGTGGNIAGKVIAASRRGRQRPAWFMPAGMAAVAAVAVLITYAVMGGFSPRPGGTAPRKDPEPGAATVTVPAPHADAHDGMKNDPSQTWLPAPGQREAVPHAAAKPSAAAKHSSPSQAAPQESIPSQAASSPETVASAPPPELNVTGIAWQKDSASRFAVVNGVSLAEGGTIAGARVREILPDRVLFSFNNKEFEVSLGKEAQ